MSGKENSPNDGRGWSQRTFQYLGRLAKGTFSQKPESPFRQLADRIFPGEGAEGPGSDEYVAGATEPMPPEPLLETDNDLLELIWLRTEDVDGERLGQVITNSK